MLGVAENRELVGVVGPPARRQYDRPDLDGHRLRSHLQVDGVGGAGFDTGRAGRPDACFPVDDVLHREGHGVRQIGGLRRVEPVVEGVWPLGGAHLGAAVTGDAAIGDHVAGVEPDRHLVVAHRPCDVLHRGQGEDLEVAVVGTDPAEVDLQSAVRRAELREVLVQHARGRRATALLHDIDVAARLGRFDGRADPGHPAADHEDSPFPPGDPCGGAPAPSRSVAAIFRLSFSTGCWRRRAPSRAPTLRSSGPAES